MGEQGSGRAARTRWGRVPAQVERMPDLGEITGDAEVRVKCMGRTYGAIARGGEVAIRDATDITRPFPLGTARVGAEPGEWRILTTREIHVLTTSDLLSALIALREAHDPAFSRPGAARSNYVR